MKNKLRFCLDGDNVLISVDGVISIPSRGVSLKKPLFETETDDGWFGREISGGPYAEIRLPASDIVYDKTLASDGDQT